MPTKEQLAKEITILLKIKNIAMQYVGRVQPNEVFSAPEIARMEMMLCDFASKYEKIKGGE